MQWLPNLNQREQAGSLGNPNGVESPFGGKPKVQLAVGSMENPSSAFRTFNGKSDHIRPVSTQKCKGDKSPKSEEAPP